MRERIQKLLAQSGFGSRREIEGWIRAGRITVNGQLAKLGDVASEDDKLTLDGRLVHLKKRETVTTRVLAYHKPVGQVSTRSDPEGRPTVFNSLPRLSGERWIAVGRLDFNTSGLILMTNNGELANRLMHPSNGMDREYAVRILGEVDNDMLQRLRDGVMLEDGKGRFEDIVDSGGEGANHWYHVVLKEGATAKFGVCGSRKVSGSVDCSVYASGQLFYRVKLDLQNFKSWKRAILPC